MYNSIDIKRYLNDHRAKKKEKDSNITYIYHHSPSFNKPQILYGHATNSYSTHKQDDRAIHLPSTRCFILHFIRKLLLGTCPLDRTPLAT